MTNDLCTRCPTEAECYNDDGEPMCADCWLEWAIETIEGEL